MPRSVTLGLGFRGGGRRSQHKNSAVPTTCHRTTGQRFEMSTRQRGPNKIFSMTRYFFQKNYMIYFKSLKMRVRVVWKMAIFAASLDGLLTTSRWTAMMK